MEPLSKGYLQDQPFCPLWRGCPLSEVIFYRVCTFGLSFVGRFVLFLSVLYWRFHCNTLFCPFQILTNNVLYVFPSNIAIQQLRALRHHTGKPEIVRLLKQLLQRAHGDRREVDHAEGRVVFTRVHDVAGLGRVDKFLLAV